MARLGDICEIQSGGTPARSNCTYWEGGTIPWVKISDIKGKHLNKTEEYITESGLQNSSAKLFPKGTILYTIFATLGETCILDIDAATNQAIAGLTVKSDIIYREYLYYYLFSLKSVVDNLGRGVAQNNINMSILRNLPVPLPPLDEQRKIAAVLDKVSDLIAKRRQQLDKLDELVKSRFMEMFGDLADPACDWPQSKLTEVCADPDDIKCGPFGTQLNKAEYRHEGVALWEIPQINAQFRVEPTHYLDFDKAAELDAYSIIPGDIAMSRKGNVGQCAVFPCDYMPGIIHSDVLRIRGDSGKMVPIFMMYQLHYSGTVKRQIEQVSSGAIMAGINVTKLKSIMVHLPPLELQEQFAAFVAQTDKSKSTIQKSLEKLEILKKALLQKYFG